jgi:hypothetical protein
MATTASQLPTVLGGEPRGSGRAPRGSEVNASGMRRRSHHAQGVAVGLWLLLGSGCAFTEISPEPQDADERFRQPAPAVEPLKPEFPVSRALTGRTDLGDPPGSVRAQSTETATASDENDRRGALQVWQKYAQCEKTREFRPCFGFLSKGALRIWAAKGVKTDEHYRDDKGSEEIQFSDVKVLGVRRRGEKITITARARGGGERGPFEARREYILVRENGDWKIDLIMEGTVKYLP